MHFTFIFCIFVKIIGQLPYATSPVMNSIYSLCKQTFNVWMRPELKHLTRCHFLRGLTSSPHKPEILWIRAPVHTAARLGLRCIFQLHNSGLVPSAPGQPEVTHTAQNTYRHTHTHHAHTRIAVCIFVRLSLWSSAITMQNEMITFFFLPWKRSRYAAVVENVERGHKSKFFCSPNVCFSTLTLIALTVQAPRVACFSCNFSFHCRGPT